MLCLIVKRPTDNQNIDRKNERQPALRKIKRAAMPTHKPTQIAAHLILPNRTQTHPPPDKWTEDNLRATFDNNSF
jgi:hypothetical protein